jgi:hypothetical protein
METKTCSKCGETKPLSEFSKRSRSKDGHAGWCKACSKVYRATWYANNQEYAKACSRDWYAENTERALRNGVTWRDKNRESARRLNAKWAANNRGKVQAKNAKWWSANPEKRRFYLAKRRAAELQATPPWADLDAIKAIYAEQQFYIDLGLDAHVDHIIPLQSETVCGLHVAQNLRIILASDNRRKSNKVPDDPYSIPSAWDEILKVSDAN